MAKSWAEKFNTRTRSEVETCEKNFGGVPAGEMFLISTPKEIDTYIRTIPEGKSVTFQQMKKDIAANYDVGYMCPLTAGIFTRIVAELAFENFSKNNKINEITPFWRVVDLKMPLAKKLSFGADFIKEMRLKEGLPL
jgi:hypothetical protein